MNDEKLIDAMGYMKACCDFSKFKNSCQKNCVSCDYRCEFMADGVLPEPVRCLVIQKADEYYSALSYQEGAWEEQKQRELESERWEKKEFKANVGIVIVLVILLIIVGVICLVYSYEYGFLSMLDGNSVSGGYCATGEDVQYDEDIVSVIYKVKKNIRDVNNDGAINCQDYSILFKLTWDKNFPSENCKLIGTTLYTKVFDTYQKHLFVRVYSKKYETWVDVEPQGEVGYYELKSYWRSKKWEVLDAYTKDYGNEVWLSTVQ